MAESKAEIQHMVMRRELARAGDGNIELVLRFVSCGGDRGWWSTILFGGTEMFRNQLDPQPEATYQGAADALAQADDWARKELWVLWSLFAVVSNDANLNAFNAIADAVGCSSWNYPGQLVRDVEELSAKAKVLRAQVDGAHRSITQVIGIMHDLREHPTLGTTAQRVLALLGG